MKHVDEYRDGKLARAIAATIAAEADPTRDYAFMEFCGGHTHAISRYGLEDLLPANVRMIHGPGCPVCVLPIGRVDEAIELAKNPDVTLATYADLMRVPGSRGASLIKAKAAGADIRMVYSTLDAIRIAEERPDRQVVFFAIGFETTTPPSAMAVKLAEARGLTNFSIFCNHVLTPSAIRAILEAPKTGGLPPVRIQGFLGPSHVSAIIGTKPYDTFVAEFAQRIVVSGFEPLDVMQSILMLLRQVNEGRTAVENQYIRAVTPEGNRAAQALVDEVFELRDSFEWRGLGAIPHSALRLRERYATFDAERRFAMTPIVASDNPACECGTILIGAKQPADCRLFGTVCTPETPMGSCMVSSEGACAAHWTYGRFRDRARASAGRAAS
ncbi:hydrogenase formation protein HypD [Siculibacillus lacustris]|uniref:Hydrogenase maturation factor n=1 Tax=Siculibacillus lacustris TaxID=1549641 RepID=A0A4Q9VUX0_9HYPH|nr:hydrogenase formation protein HypD [Siculibacillus lacustris]TBW40021.1 hydrogenase formation protein HypD [Siculibacillus lacustris]